MREKRRRQALAFLGPAALVRVAAYGCASAYTSVVRRGEANTCTLPTGPRLAARGSFRRRRSLWRPPSVGGMRVRRWRGEARACAGHPGPSPNPTCAPLQRRAGLLAPAEAPVGAHIGENVVASP